MEQALDMPASLLASAVVAMEITLSAVMKVGKCPDELLKKVCTCMYMHATTKTNMSISLIVIVCNRL